jgi:hypothetical protein
MPRVLSGAMITALSAPVLNPAIFVQVEFLDHVDGTTHLDVFDNVYVWTGIGSVSWNSQTWIGLGAFLGLTTPEDSSVVEAKGITLTFSGIDPTVLPDALNKVVLGAPVTIYLALYDGSHTLIADPVIAWAGRLDQPTFDVDPQEVSLSINCESRLLDMNVAVDRRLTNEDQQMNWPGDLGFQFVDGLQQQTIFWGQFPTGSNL